MPKVSMFKKESATGLKSLCSLGIWVAVLGGCQAQREPQDAPLSQLHAALSSWSQQTEFTGMDSLAQDRFGSAVAIDADTVVVGADKSDVGQGAAYVFLRSGTTWTQQQELSAPDGSKGDGFGCSVAVSGDTAVIGACFGVPMGGMLPQQGTAYIFSRSGTTWSLSQELTAMDAAAMDEYGAAVAIDGTTVVVGAPNHMVGTYAAQGQAYVYVLSGGTWMQQQILNDSTGGAAGDNFGNSVSVSGDTAVIGANDKTVGMNGKQGQAYVFTRSGTKWSVAQDLLASDGAAGDLYGSAVAINGTSVIVGAPQKNGAQGGAYIYDLSGMLGEQILSASDGLAGDKYGSSVAINGNNAVVGAPEKMVGANSGQGQAYMIGNPGTSWTEQKIVAASDGMSSDQFGNSVSMSGITAAIGAFTRNMSQGEVYVFYASATNGSSCTAPTDCLTGNCVDGVCCDTPCGYGSPSDCQSCLGAQTGGKDGTCAPISAGTLCAASAGICDMAGLCDGKSTACPGDTRKPKGTPCRTSLGPCDDNTCDGFLPFCPNAKTANFPAGTLCKAAGANPTCDPPDVCNGTSKLCPAHYAPPGTPCGAGQSCNGLGICR